MSNCVLINPLTRNGAKAIEEYDSEYRNLNALMTSVTEDSLESGIADAYNKSAQTLDVLVNQFTDGKFPTLKGFQESASVEQKTFFRILVGQAVINKIRADENPQQAYASALQYKYTRDAALYADKLRKSSTILYNAHNVFSKQLGEIYANRVDTLQHWGPARDVMFFIDTMRQYTNSTSRTIMNRARTIMDKASNSDIFRKNKITLSVISEILPMFDGQMMSKNNGESGMLDYLQTRFKMSEDNTKTLYSEFKNIVAAWNHLNYGVEDPSTIEGGVQALKSKPIPGSVMEYYATVKRNLDEMKSRVGYNDDVLKEIDYRLDFNYRNDYIPTRTDDHIFEGLQRVSEVDGVDFFIPKNVNSRAEANSDIKGDFVDTLQRNILGMAILYQKLSMYTGHKALTQFISDAKTTGIADKSGQYNLNKVILSAEFYNKDLKRMVEHKNMENTTAVQTIKTIGSFFTWLPAAILFMPSSAIVNTVAGKAALVARLGSEHIKDGYVHSLASSDTSSQSVTAKLCQDYAHKYLVSPGFVESYETLTMDGVNQAGVLKLMQDKAMQVADRMGEGLFGHWVKSYKDNLTVKGTETSLREYSASLLYNRVMKRLAISGDITGDGNKLKERINTFIKDEAEQVYYDINGALGNFNPSNKAWWIHGRYDNAENVATAMVGLAAKTYGVFRQVVGAVLSNFITSAEMNSTAYLMKDKGWRDYSGINRKGFSYSGATILGLGTLAMYDLMRDLLFPDKKSIHTGFLESVNPLQGPADPIKWAIASALHLSSGGRINDDDWKRIKENSIRYLAGISYMPMRRIDETGDQASDVFFGMFNEESRKIAKEYMFGDMNPLSLLAKGIEVDTSIRGEQSALYDQRTEMRTAYSAFNSIDPIVLARTLMELRIHDPNDEEATGKFQVNTIQNYIQSIFGASLWLDGPYTEKTFTSYHKKRYDNFYDDYQRSEFKRNKLLRLNSTSLYLPHDYEFDATVRALNRHLPNQKKER